METEMSFNRSLTSELGLCYPECQAKLGTGKGANQGKIRILSVIVEERADIILSIIQ